VLLNQVLTGDNDKLNFGVSYEQGNLGDQSGVNTEDRFGLTVSTQINDRILINGRVGVPVGGVSETVVAGDVEVQVLLNDEGTLSVTDVMGKDSLIRFRTKKELPKR